MSPEIGARSIHNVAEVPSRRDFLKAASAAAAAAAVGPAVLGADRTAGDRSEKIVGIQVGAVSFLDEGTERVLDVLQERGAVNALYLAAFTHGRGIGGRQVPGHPFPDHGVRQYDLGFHGGNFATPHPQYYSRTAIAPTKAPDYGDYDLIADVLPKARSRKIAVYAWYEDSFRDDIPGVLEAKEIDWQGRRGESLCPLNPDYREFLKGLTEDYCRSYEIDGVMWGSERQGPLHNAIGAKHGGPGDPGRVTCFCEHHRKAARERGIDVDRAIEGFRRLDRFVRAARSGRKPNDGAFVAFWRLLLDYPELLAWEKLWTDGKHAIYSDIFGVAKGIRPELKVGFHIWHANSFSPFFRAEQDYGAFARTADFLKIVLYNNCGGPRYADYIRNVGSTIFRDVPEDELLRLHNAWLGYGGEAPLAKLSTAGLSAGYVGRETARALADVDRNCLIVPGIDIDVPTAAGEKQTSPDDVYASTLAALRAGSDGVLYSRKYSEMRLDNLSAGGRAVRNS